MHAIMVWVLLQVGQPQPLGYFPDNISCVQAREDVARGLPHISGHPPSVFCRPQRRIVSQTLN
jgi:hypothetical protein